MYSAENVQVQHVVCKTCVWRNFLVLPLRFCEKIYDAEKTEAFIVKSVSCWTINVNGSSVLRNIVNTTRWVYRFTMQQPTENDAIRSYKYLHHLCTK